MNNLIGSAVGLIHLLAALLATITGTMVLFMKKGTKRHKKIGYVDVFSMLLLNATAFMTYRLRNVHPHSRNTILWYGWYSHSGYHAYRRTSLFQIQKDLETSVR